MIAFLKIVVPGFVPPSRNKVAATMKKKYHEYRSKMRKLLAHIDHISLTADLWKNKKNWYHVGINGHFYDKNFKFHSIQLGFRRMFGRHFPKRIKEYIKYEINQLKIEKKVVSITTDNERDIKKAVSEGFN